MKERGVYIVSAVRTPFGKYGGAYKNLSSSDLGAIALREVIKRISLAAKSVDEIYYGSCIAMEIGVGLNIPGRQAVLKAGFPEDVPSMSIDTACCSSMDAVYLGWAAIARGESNVVITAGADNMERQAYFLPPEFRFGKMRGDIRIVDPIARGGNYPLPQVGPVSLDAGHEALEWGISREEQDGWAYMSHGKYSQALSEGRLQDEIVPLEIKDDKGNTVLIDRDEQHRPEVSMEKLASLPTVYGSPTVTAGNAPGINAGAAALVLMSGEKVKEMGLRPIARIIRVARVATTPNKNAAAPAKSITKCLSEAGVAIKQIDLIEINEAFAAMPLTSTKVLGGGEEERTRRLREITNVNGGSVAIGHPVGATGARILMTLAYELSRRGGRYGVASICGGLGQTTAALIRSEIPGIET